MSSLCEGEEHSSRPATQCCWILHDANIVKKNINCSYSCSIQFETGLFWIKVMKVDLINRYESFATVGEIRVWWRADFRSGSRVLKKVF